MRELERHDNIFPASLPARLRIGILGAGRMGRVMAAGLARAGLNASAPLPRGGATDGFDVVLLCVPDASIADAARTLASGPLVGHCSGATGLDVLAPHEAFSLHPLMTVTGHDGPERLAGAGAAIAGSTPRALAVAGQLAGALDMHPFELRSEERAAYHAAAAMASNFLITLEAAAEQVAAGTGLGRADLAALVRATVENWAALGPEEALTGPVARGDVATVQRQRTAVSERAPELVELFDVLVTATQRLATGRPQEVAA